MRENIILISNAKKYRTVKEVNISLVIFFNYYLEKVLSLQYYKKITIGDKVLVRHTYKLFLLYGNMEMHLHLE